ncbi:MAG: hydroxymethylglutaryl-CoA reductase, degradative [Gammaproteobacteria bacterium]|nr:hydroxymethylglutaryl-CoA reductase, degradative [Gammaproteobacteria bacterium]
MSDSRIAGLYKLGVSERIAELERLGWLAPAQAAALLRGRQVLSISAADKMIENVVGVFALPFAIAPNFTVNGRDCLLPLVVEEPSIVAALSSAAGLAREGGGFQAKLEESLLAGQIYISDCPDRDAALAAIQASREELIQLADAVHPRLAERGGGVRSIEDRSIQLPSGACSVVVHVLVDTCDAMGANAVNTICEAIAPRIEELCGGHVALRILSNLADRSVVTATVRFPSELLRDGNRSGAAVRDSIVLANDLALADPYRAATHNKGIMNGIDAVAIATGNDWRAIEAGAHAYAARNGHYAALTDWSVAENGDLAGRIDIPLKVGTVGGTLKSNPAAAMGLAIAAVTSAKELAELMAVVGLAQNFAALKALATTGIQAGHMRMHARSVAANAGVPGHRLDEVVERLVESGEVKAWKAREILCDLQGPSTDALASTAAAAGKVILFGEHAVVYGRHALALPIENAVSATVSKSDSPSTLRVADWDINLSIDANRSDGLHGAINIIRDALGVADYNFAIDVRSHLPRGVGLGSSAAIAVALTRAIALCADVKADDARVNGIAYECEKLFHGTPSGIDNTLACYGQPTLFRSSDGLRSTALAVAEPPPVVVAISGEVGLTRELVAGVRERYDESTSHYEQIFDQIDSMSQQGAKLLQRSDYESLGRLMNVCQGLLNAIEVSTPDLERMIAIARNAGAVGAKLTGAGGGGSIVALCPGNEEQVRTALRQAGYQTLDVAVGTEHCNE